MDEMKASIQVLVRHGIEVHHMVSLQFVAVAAVGLLEKNSSSSMPSGLGEPTARMT